MFNENLNESNLTNEQSESEITNVKNPERCQLKNVLNNILMSSNLERAQNQIEDLKKKLYIMTENYKQSKDENKLLLKSLSTLEKEKVENGARSLVSTVLTKNQLDLILKKKKKVVWTTEEISNAFALRCLSQRAYLYVRNTLKYPLPGLSSLRRWASKVNMTQGILKDIIKIMNISAKKASPIEKLVVLQFDEVKVAYQYEYHKAYDVIMGPFSQMQVVLVRGLVAKWKQPVFMDFDQKMTDEILNNIIEELHNVGYTVVACVSDCGGGNMGLWKKLNINIENTSFCHPSTGEPIFMFADAPHLLKLIRNWLVDTGFKMDDGSIVSKQPIEELLKITDSEVSSCYQLTKKHLECVKTQRQNVALASQLLSHTVGTALKHYSPGFDKHLASNTGEFILLINKWFDIMNSSNVCAAIPTKRPFGLHIEEQKNILQNVIKTFSSMRVLPKLTKSKVYATESNCLFKEKKSIEIFQKGVIVSSLSLQNLYDYVHEKFNMKYILTRRLNQDALESFFSQLRTRGGLNDHPTPLNALYRIRMMILGKTPGLVVAHTNTIDTEQDEFLMATLMKAAKVITNN